MQTNNPEWKMESSKWKIVNRKYHHTCLPAPMTGKSAKIWTLLFVLFASTLFAQVPRTISYQGVLIDGVFVALGHLSTLSVFSLV